MEIINPNSLPGDNARGCTTDALAPEHSCLAGGGCGQIERQPLGLADGQDGVSAALESEQDLLLVGRSYVLH